MIVTATYPDFKVVEVSIDPWDKERAVESFYDCGAIMVQVRED